MTRRAVLTLLSLFAALAPMQARQDAPGTDDRVVLITLDGVRTQEIFGGLDVDILKSTLAAGRQVEDHPAYQRYWAASPEERRRKLMPFLWTLVTEHGSIAGNRRLGSAVTLGNRHWFSYPGYAEILVGEAFDDEIKSNDATRNPHPTVLEAIRDRFDLAPAKVATFAGWGVFNQIAEHREGATFTNAGIEPLSASGAEIATMNQMQGEAAAPWDNVRFDAFTFRLAMAHLASARPRVLYLAFDETDDWAHDGHYDRVLRALDRTDAYLRELWNWLQSQPDYRGRTHVLITTDHGRGRTAKDWRDHGARIDGANEVWMAFASPTMSRRGEWRDAAPLTSGQVAATVGAWMGVDWTAAHPRAGKPIQ